MFNIATQVDHCQYIDSVKHPATYPRMQDEDLGARSVKFHASHFKGACSKGISLHERAAYAASPVKMQSIHWRHDVVSVVLSATCSRFDICPAGTSDFGNVICKQYRPRPRLLEQDYVGTAQGDNGQR